MLRFTGRPVGAKRTQQGSRPRRFSSEIEPVADADAVMRAEGCTRTAGRVRTYGAAGVSSSGHAFKGILQEPKRASHLLRGGTGHQGRPEVTVDGWRSSRTTP